MEFSDDDGFGSSAVKSENRGAKKAEPCGMLAQQKESGNVVSTYGYFWPTVI